MNATIVRRRPPRVVGFGLLLLTAGLAAALVAAFRPARDTPHAGAQPGTSADPSELAQLSDEVKLLRRQLQAVAAQRTPAPSGEASSTALAPPAAKPRITPDEALAQDRRHFDNLERTIATQAIDAAWAPQTERLIAGKFKLPELAGSKLVGSSCRSTICRIEVTHTDEAQRRRFRGTFPTRLAEFQSGTMRKGTGATPSTIVYVAREGHQIPRAAED